MKTELHWLDGTLPGRLALMPRPRGGDWLEDEVRSWRRSGVDVVVSLLAPDEVADLDLVREREFCEANDMRFLSFPIVDRSVPSSRDAAFELLATLAEALADRGNVAIHCRQGIGRAGLIAACLSVFFGASPEDAVERVGKARGCPVPETPEQRRWIADFARMQFQVRARGK